jgi:hypothetical protein
MDVKNIISNLSQEITKRPEVQKSSPPPPAKDVVKVDNPQVESQEAVKIELTVTAKQTPVEKKEVSSLDEVAKKADAIEGLAKQLELAVSEQPGRVKALVTETAQLSASLEPSSIGSLSLATGEKEQVKIQPNLEALQASVETMAGMDPPKIEAIKAVLGKTIELKTAIAKLTQSVGNLSQQPVNLKAEEIASENRRAAEVSIADFDRLVADVSNRVKGNPESALSAQGVPTKDRLSSLLTGV